MAYQEEIIRRIIKGIFISVMDKFGFDEIATKESLHNVPMFIFPYIRHSNFCSPINNTTRVVKATRTKWQYARMTFGGNRVFYSRFSSIIISTFFIAIRALSWIIKGFSVSPSLRNDRLATNSTWFVN